MAGIGATSLLTACGFTSSGDDATGGSGDAGSDTGDDSAPWEPVTIEHAFGSTTIETRPTRIVSAGLTEQDFLLALGITPIAITDWYGDQPYGVWPWATSALGDAEPTLLNTNDGLQFTRIAGLKPDLIVACNASLEKDDYDKLSKIAPTLAQSGDQAVFEPWPDTFKSIGAAVGKADETAEITASVKKKFSDAAAANPQWAGKNAIFLQNAVYDGNLIAYQKGLSTEFITDLGFDVPADIDRYAEEGAQAYIPVERISVLDSADVLIWGTETDADKAALEKVPGFSSLTAVKDQASLYTGGELAGAIYFASPLSLPYVVDTLVPQLSDALPAS